MSQAESGDSDDGEPQVVGAALNEALAAIVGRDNVLTKPEATERYAVDWTGRFRGEPVAVVRPGSTVEVSAVLRLCLDAGIPVVPQGGNTGLVGGAVPRRRELVLSLARLRTIGEVERLSAQVTVDAGVTLGTLQRHARAAGFDFPVDLGARESATVGGLIATNAGGIHVLRHGSMRSQVVGLEAVLANGEVVDRTSGLLKDNAGYHLPSLLVGSEGTLAVITRARLRLVPHAAHRVAVIAGVASSADGLRLLQHLLHRVSGLEAAEIFYADGLELVKKHVGIAPPFSTAAHAYLLLEAAGQRDPTDELVDALHDRRELVDAALASDSPGRSAFWRLREAHIEAIAREGAPHRFDVAVPRERVADFEQRVRRAVATVAPHLRCVVYGHLGDGNLHVNVIGAIEHQDDLDEAVLEIVVDLSGSISAEHGIGVEKVRLLERTRSEADLAAMRAIKHALDPQRILNPGVLFD